MEGRKGWRGPYVSSWGEESPAQGHWCLTCAEGQAPVPARGGDVLDGGPCRCCPLHPGSCPSGRGASPHGRRNTTGPIFCTSKPHVPTRPGAAVSSQGRVPQGRSSPSALFCVAVEVSLLGLFGLGFFFFLRSLQVWFFFTSAALQPTVGSPGTPALPHTQCRGSPRRSGYQPRDASQREVRAAGLDRLFFLFAKITAF